MSHLLHIADRVLNRPLLILPDKLALIASVLEGRIGIDATDLKGVEYSEELRSAPGATRFVGDAEYVDPNNPRSQVKYRTSNGVALIPVLGSLVSRGAWLGASSGMTSYEGLAFQIADAVANPKIKSIVLDIDSPGGEAVGAFEIADKVRSAAKVKPVTAMINGMAASAAYAIASAATQIIATPSGVAGSIGVVLMHADYSNMLHQKGVKPTFIHAGAHKVDGNPYEPLSPGVKADLQAEVDQFYDLFVSSVAKGRKGRMTEKAIRGTEARTYIGQAALDAGLVDAIGSFETVLADLTSQARPVPAQKRDQSSGPVLEHQAPTADAVRSAVDRATILEAGRKAGFEKLATLLADQPHKTVSLDAALELIRISARTQSENERNASGLWLDPRMTVSGGPLFAAPDAGPAGQSADHGWNEIVANLNKTLN